MLGPQVSSQQSLARGFSPQMIGPQYQGINRGLAPTTGGPPLSQQMSYNRGINPQMLGPSPYNISRGSGPQSFPLQGPQAINPMLMNRGNNPSMMSLQYPQMDTLMKGSPTQYQQQPQMFADSQTSSQGKLPHMGINNSENPLGDGPGLTSTPLMSSVSPGKVALNNRSLLLSESEIQASESGIGSISENMNLCGTNSSSTTTSGVALFSNNNNITVNNNNNNNAVTSRDSIQSCLSSTINNSKSNRSILQSMSDQSGTLPPISEFTTVTSGGNISSNINLTLEPMKVTNRLLGGSVKSTGDDASSGYGSPDSMTLDDR